MRGQGREEAARRGDALPPKCHPCVSARARGPWRGWLGFPQAEFRLFQVPVELGAASRSQRDPCVCVCREGVRYLGFYSWGPSYLWSGFCDLSPVITH